MFAKGEAGYLAKALKGGGVMWLIRRQVVRGRAARGKTLGTRRRVLIGLKKDNLAEGVIPKRRDL
jgi:hypothetical protein